MPTSASEYGPYSESRIQRPTSAADTRLASNVASSISSDESGIRIVVSCPTATISRTLNTAYSRIRFMKLPRLLASLSSNFHVCLHRLLHDVFQRHMMLNRNAPAIVIFRSVICDCAIHAGDLESHVTPARGHRNQFAGKNLAPFLSTTYTQCSGFGENEIRQPAGVLRT